jgi:hypothetical protein
VGSDVVCSTLKGVLEPQSVERATDGSTLFYALKFTVILCVMRKIRTQIASIAVGTIIAMMGMSSCESDINSIQDSHFDADGTPLDTTYVAFVPQRADLVKIYIETSGSMNGFFRANRSNRFKKTVWSVVSGLQHRSDNNVYTMSNGGDIDSRFCSFRFEYFLRSRRVKQTSEEYSYPTFATVFEDRVSS